jgi:hypothetical protein
MEIERQTDYKNNSLPKVSIDMLSTYELSLKVSFRGQKQNLQQTFLCSGTKYS